MLYCAGFKEHYSLFAGPGTFFSAVQNELTGCEQRKGNCPFPMVGAQWPICKILARLKIPLTAYADDLRRRARWVIYVIIERRFQNLLSRSRFFRHDHIPWPNVHHRAF